MSTNVSSAATVGIDATPIEVEVHLEGGLPSFRIVGLGDKAVEESKERVSAAITNSGAKPPQAFHQRAVVNLAPADLKKEGSAYDLAIAVGLLIASHQIPALSQPDTIFVGELGLDGTVRPVPGILAMTELAKKRGAAIVVPRANYREASVLADAVRVIPVNTLTELILHVEGSRPVAQVSEPPQFVPGEPPFDISEISGLPGAKRALEIAAAGSHHILMRGSPGTGKTLLAKALPSILPPLTFTEALEVTKIYSIAGLLDAEHAFITTRPFRDPHHTASVVALVGGGANPLPGEISLAHRGVLFLDEFPEFPRSLLESLRQPLEDGTITVSRAKGKLTFPARFMLVAAMNPCPCGFFGDPRHACTCAPGALMAYQKRVSGPMLDRMDIVIQVPRTNISELNAKPDKTEGARMRERIVLARHAQEQRFAGTPLHTNSELNPRLIRKHCILDARSQTLLERAATTLALSPRSIHRILRVSRTIADLEISETIKEEHLAEALQYRDDKTN